MTNTIERARQSIRALGDTGPQLAALQAMTVGELAEKYRELYGEPTRTRNKAYLQKRLSWRIQELADGGLSLQALARIKQLGDTLPERWRQRDNPAPVDITVPQPLEPRDPRIPAVGTVLKREHQGASFEVTVCDEGFDYQGERYKTLSAIAQRITGTRWNGYLFFGLTKRRGAPESQISAQEAPAASETVA